MYIHNHMTGYKRQWSKLTLIACVPRWRNSMFRTLTRSDKKESKKLYILDFRRQKDVYHREAKAMASLIICVFGLKYANKTDILALKLKCCNVYHMEKTIYCRQFLISSVQYKKPLFYDMPCTNYLKQHCAFSIPQC